ncbi:MAG: TlpA family protein disulfide reductase [Planctomycetaceae bacterium]
MNGLQAELEDEVDFVRLNLRTPIGVEVAREYGVQFAGTHVLLGRDGDELYRIRGTPDASEIRALLGKDLRPSEL